MKREHWELLAAAAAAALITWLCLEFGPRFAQGDPNATPLSAAGDAAKLLTLTLGVPAAILALFNHGRSVRQQREAAQWRRREYVAKVMADFEGDAQNRFCMSILDYNARRLTLPGTTVARRYDERDMLIALTPREDRGVYGLNDVLIRDAFDAFFNALDRVGEMCLAELIEWEDVEPYAAYWLKLLGRAPRERSELFDAAVRRYVTKFDFEGVAHLMRQVGLEPQVSEADEALVREFIATLPKREAKPVRKAAAASRGKRKTPRPSGQRRRPKPMTKEEEDEEEEDGDE
jgi:hypothetical protein